jgi:3D (Asp-Asp-Asp) domain-containing protein
MFYVRLFLFEQSNVQTSNIERSTFNFQRNRTGKGITHYIEPSSTYNAIYGMSRLKNKKKAGARHDLFKDAAGAHRVPAVCGAAVAQRGKRLAARCLVLLLMAVVSGCCFLPHRMEEHGEEVSMVVTAYCSCQKCCAWKRSIWSCWLVPVHSSGPFKGKRKKVGITADGTRAEKGVIAADISTYPYGTRMYVPGYGWGVVHDRGREIKGNHIDVFFDSHDDALKWGTQKLTVTVIR